MLFCSIDSKAKGWKHGALRAAKKLRGLPSRAFLDADGTVLIRIPVRAEGWPQFAVYGMKARRYVRLRAAAAKGDKLARAAFLGMQLHERQLTLARAETIRRDVAGVIDKTTAAALDCQILHLRIADEIRAKGQKRRHELGPRFYKMLTAGPNPGLDVGRGFWYALLEWAERSKKPVEFAVSLAAMRRALAFTDPDAAWVPGLLARYEATLRKLRADAERK